MNTRKVRKKTWKAQEAEELNMSEVHKVPDTSSDDKVLESPLKLFLDAWRDAKETQVKENPNLEVPETIAEIMNVQGYPISVNVARTKIGNFIKKYNFAKKMASQGNKYAWKHFNAVKSILEYGPAITSSKNSNIEIPQVIIPIGNIKIEKRSNSIDNTLIISEAKASTEGAHKSGQKSNVQNGGNDVELIEIQDDENQQLKRKAYFSESEGDMEIDTEGSEISDGELDFENPLDQIQLVISGSKDSSERLPQLKMPKLEKMIKSPPSARTTSPSKDIKTSPIPTLIKKENLPQDKKIPSQSHIIPLPSNFSMPRTAANGSPQQYLIVRPITPQGGKTQTSQSTIAIPLAPNLTTQPRIPMISTPSRFVPPNLRNGIDLKQQLSPNARTINIPSVPGQVIGGSLTQPPPLTPRIINSNPSRELSATQNNESTNQESSSPGIRRLLNNVIKLETNIFNLQKDRLKLERERFEMEREYGKQMIDIFREIKDKICDIQCSSSVNNTQEKNCKQKNQDENAQQKT